jgi:hypothetical protein
MFVKMYIIKKGFLDGLIGFILSLLCSSFYTLMKYGKLWELEKNEIFVSDIFDLFHFI